MRPPSEGVGQQTLTPVVQPACNPYPVRVLSSMPAPVRIPSLPASANTIQRSGTLEEKRRKHNISPLAVRWDSYITDTIAWRHYNPQGYEAWAITGADSQGRPLGRDGQNLANGQYLYVVLTDNSFRYLPKTDTGEQYRSHSQLAGGQTVYAAGAFTVSNGQITIIDNSSGHYRPVGSSPVIYAKNVLKKLGITINRHSGKSGQDVEIRGFVPTDADRAWVPWLKHQALANARALKDWVVKTPGRYGGFPDVPDELAKDMPY
jgi:hypothetical protein